MGWKATGAPTVRKQRDKWVVRVDGIDTATGKHRPRQLGTYPSQRAAPGGGPLRPGRPAQHRTRDGQLARAPLRRRSHRHHAEVAGELRVGDPAHRSRPRRHPRVPPRPRGRRRVDRTARRRRRAVEAQCADLPHRPARRARRGRGRGDHPAQPGRPGRASPHRRQAGQGQGDRRLGHPRRDPLPRGDTRAPLGRRVPPRRALRTPPQRGAGAPLGRPRPRRRDTADRPERRRRQHGRRME